MSSATSVWRSPTTSIGSVECARLRSLYRRVSGRGRDDGVPGIGGTDGPLDTVFHRIGLHGFAIVPMVLSFGCNVPGVAATRTLETDKQRFITMTLLSVVIPCGAQLGVMLSLIPQYTGYILLYLLAGFFVFGAILNKVIPGSSPEVAIDIPPMRQPRLENVATKLWLRLRGFVTTAVPLVLFGVAVVNVLYLGRSRLRIRRGSGRVLSRRLRHGRPNERRGAPDRVDRRRRSRVRRAGRRGRDTRSRGTVRVHRPQAGTRWTRPREHDAGAG